MRQILRRCNGYICNLPLNHRFISFIPAMKTTPALELRDVSYAANGQPVLQSINWTVLPGEHWAILGPNGSGKTTLLQLACGYLWPNAGGEIRRRGRVLADLRELRKSIGWVTSSLAPQIPAYEKVIRTVVSGKFAQVGLLEDFGGRATKADFRLAAKLLEQMDALICANVNLVCSLKANSRRC